MLGEKRQKGRGAPYLCTSHVKASEKALFKNKPTETPEGAPGSALWPFGQTPLKLQQWKIKNQAG